MHACEYFHDNCQLNPCCDRRVWVKNKIHFAKQATFTHTLKNLKEKGILSGSSDTSVSDRELASFG